MTQTSSFGTSKREGHDSSTFYERNLYSAFFKEAAAAKEVTVPAPVLDEKTALPTDAQPVPTEIPLNGQA
jgi:hypothetical protein